MMKKLSLNNEINTGFVEIPVDFIDTFMPQAEPEVLKTYLYILRASADPSVSISVPDLADLFDVTPNKITRALFCLEEEKLLKLTNEGGEIAGITLLPYNNRSEKIVSLPERTSASEASYARPAVKDAPAAAEPGTPAVLRQDAPVDFSLLEKDPSFTELSGLLQYYTRKPVTSVQYEALGFCYLLLDRNYDLTEYLIEYCVEEGHASMHYMKSVARSWNTENLKSLEDVKKYCADKRKRVYTVRKALGITNRSLVQQELDYIDKWMQDFSLELISYACARTISQIASPSFRYVDSILTAWKDAGVKTRADVDALDQQHARKKKSEEAAAPGSRNFGFTQRSADYDSLASAFYE